ncbi:MFS transporter [Sporosarcina newyorkensis]|uniref:MFS transporter, AAHS family, benzoate transport protein n=1 Tax=Sporosarcina newyorkensis TaxID=759851 RepID=A0A1T4YTQ0_9BACL|nr:aromatic acid/H+ symport family MFS transporter [Sporosarcina newyorkensis]SKB04615.1 MFS transporter, AAHS family, benzoate transport protein [Sporosarcina newyorkensis]
MKAHVEENFEILEKEKSQANKGGIKSISKVTILVTIICWFTIFVEGYDLVVYGVVLPVLMDPSGWGLTATQAGAMGSYALLGMFLGSSIGGILCDKIGRKTIIIASIALMSIMMVLTALAPTPELFAIYRFLAGLGIGGIVPSASALTTEYSPAKYRSFFFVIMYSGFAVGGVAAALSGVFFIENFGWRSLFWLGATPILFIPFFIKYLPESIKFLQANNQQVKAKRLIEKYRLPDEFVKEEQSEGTANESASIFSKRYLVSTILFSIVYIGAFLLIYGMNTWLPQIMKEAGYPMNSSLLFLLVFNLSAVVGGIIAGRVADRLQPKKVISFIYFLAAISILLLSIKFNTVVLYILIAIAGFGTTGTTFVLASYVMRQYNDQNRASALGIASAIGRFGAIAGPLLVGILMGMNAGYEINFYLFGVVAILASLVILFMPSFKSVNASK